MVKPSLPLLRLDTIRRGRLDRPTLDIVPICAQRRAVALDEALHHSPLLLWGAIGVELLEKLVDVGRVLIFALADVLPILGA